MFTICIHFNMAGSLVLFQAKHLTGEMKPVRNDPRAKRLGHGRKDPVSYGLGFKLSESRKNKQALKSKTLFWKYNLLFLS